MGELFDAIERYDERKAAAATGGPAVDVDGAGYHADDIENAMFRRLVSDLDLDLAEVAAAIDAVYRSGVVAARNQVNARDILGGMWVDGLVTGLLLARLRTEAADGKPPEGARA